MKLQHFCPRSVPVVFSSAGVGRAHFDMRVSTSPHLALSVGGVLASPTMECFFWFVGTIFEVPKVVGRRHSEPRHGGMEIRTTVAPGPGGGVASLTRP